MRQALKFMIIICTIFICTYTNTHAATDKTYITDNKGNVITYKDSNDLKYVYPVLINNMGKSFYLKTRDGLTDTYFWCVLVSNEPQNFAEALYSFEVETDAEPNTLKVTLFDMQTKEQSEAVEDRIDEIYKSLKIKDSDSIYTKTKKIHDWTVKNIDYETTYKSLYSTLIGDTAKCDGFSSIFYKLANRAGLTNRIVVGIDKKYQNAHAWNMVKMDDGLWYIVDCSKDAIEYANNRNMYKHFLQNGKNSYSLGKVQNFDIQKLKAIEPYREK